MGPGREWASHHLWAQAACGGTGLSTSLGCSGVRFAAAATPVCPSVASDRGAVRRVSPHAPLVMCRIMLCLYVLTHRGQSDRGATAPAEELDTAGARDTGARYTCWLVCSSMVGSQWQSLVSMAVSHRAVCERPPVLACCGQLVGLPPLCRREAWRFAGMFAGGCLTHAHGTGWAWSPRAELEILRSPCILSGV